MFENLTGGVCLGDTFGVKVKQAQFVQYIKSGQPCPNYSYSGDGTGQKGDTGWMFTKQVEVILHHLPWAFCLEISDNAPNINGGAEVSQVRKSLSAKYVVYGSVLKVWNYGDPSNRRRLFMVGLLADLGQTAHEFVWPTVSFDECGCIPVARCIAVPDSAVDASYWRDNHIKTDQLLKHSSSPHSLQVISRLAPGMGHSRNPHTILTWDGLLNGQTSYNGGGQRPSVDWKPGNCVSRTRLVVPIETVRAASLDDTSDSGYAQWASTFVSERHDTFLRLCVNNGVPMRTGTAIDEVIFGLLSKAKVSMQQPTVKWASLCWQWQALRRMLFDTGANGHLNFKDLDQALKNSRIAMSNITVANKGSLDVGLTGTLSMIVMNSGNQPGVETNTRVEIDTTTADVSCELFSFDPFYRDGWGCDIQPHSGNGTRTAWIYRSDPDVRIPMTYDWNSGGGFWIDYMVADSKSAEHRALLARHHVDISEEAESRKDSTVNMFNAEQSRAMHKHAAEDKSVVDVVIGQHSEDRAIRGTKAGLKSKQQKMPISDFHVDYGHMGSCVGTAKRPCLICRLVKGAARKIFSKVDPHRETRPGFKWHMDTVTWSGRSKQGNKYMTVLRCEACDFYKIFAHYLRSDIMVVIELWIKTIRLDPAFNDCRYKMVSVIMLDNAGEWARDCVEFQSMLNALGVMPVYSCPDRKESAALAERSVGIVEVVVKSLLMQNSLPGFWWEYCASGAEFLLNRFPTAKLEGMSLDGDAPRPLELYSRFTYSRRQIDRELSYWVMPGTPALVQTTAKGSLLGPKTRWGVAIGMYREQVVFYCPYQHSTFTSKSFAAFQLQLGMNYAQWLGLGPLKPSNKSATIPIDFTEKIVIQLPSDDWYAEYQSDQGAKAEAAEAGLKPKSVVALKVAGSLADTVPVIKVIEPKSNLGGSVQLERINPSELVMTQLTPVKELLSDVQPAVTKVMGGKLIQGKAQDNSTQGLPQCKVVIQNSTEALDWFDSEDALRVRDKGLTADGTQTFVRICKDLELPFEVHRLYREWLLKHKGISVSVLPTESYAKVPAGVKFDYPSGSHWCELVRVGSRKHQRANHVDIDDNQVAVDNAVAWVESQVSGQQSVVANGGSFAFSVQHAMRAMMTGREMQKMQSKNKAKKKKSAKAVAAGKLANPANARAALGADDGDDWVDSMGVEFYGLVEEGVFDLGFTAQQLIEAGITASPVPCAPYFEYKYGVDGQVDKLKTRVAIQGHPGNMQKGVHFDKTFSATPQESTSRIVCCLVVLYSLIRGAFDISKAFTWATLPPGDQIALCYPDGFKEYDPVTGEPLYMILRKNLYGHPAAGRQFGKQRDSVLQLRFNEKGWTCQRTRMDPCLWLIKREYENKMQWALLLIHVDDCDIAGTTQLIVTDVIDVCKTIWKIKEVDPEYMLGVRRRVKRDPVTDKVLSMELDMIPFVEGMYNTFKDRMPAVAPDMPIEAKFTCSTNDQTPAEESAAVLEAGYQCAMGMLLWAARRVYSGCRVGVSLLCRVMSKPSWRAFYAAMQMIAWIHANRTQGLLFTAGINTRLLGMVDASNKPDPADGKCQFGFVFMWMGAAVLDHSKKLRHIGLSSEHNEYMAMHFAHQALVWFRQLMSELELTALLEVPTIMLADNKPANILSQEDIVSMGNQYIYLPYHYNKEVQEEGFSEVRWVHSPNNISDLMTKCGGSKEYSTLMMPLMGYDTRLICKLAKDAYG